MEAGSSMADFFPDRVLRSAKESTFAERNLTNEKFGDRPKDCFRHGPLNGASGPW
jgi:hypothetical protein